MSERGPVDSHHSGMPLHVDQFARKWADACDPSDPVHSWYPSNPPAEKLWRILECLRDLSNGLPDAPMLLTPADKQRRVKLLATPLYSLVAHIRALCNELETSADLRDRLAENERRNAAALRVELERDLPIEKEGALRAVRDQLAAHIDENMVPERARRALSEATPPMFRDWIHRALTTVYQLLSYRVYGWTTRDTTPHQFQLMTSEPFLLTLRLDDDNRLSEILDVTVVQTPKYEIATQCRELVRRIDAFTNADNGRDT
jgi:hypothetical protein